MTVCLPQRGLLDCFKEYMCPPLSPSLYSGPYFPTPSPSTQMTAP